MTQKTISRNLPLAYLRGFLILLVVAHHACLAYFPKGPAIPIALVNDPRWWPAFPVIDTRHWAGFLPFVAFNDSFFMGLMFLISGLMVWRSLKRKQAGLYFKHRLLRLGLPFVIASLMSPLTYYPTYLQSRTHPGFWHEWMSLGAWPAGPAWFLWVLLVFDTIALAIFKWAPGPFLDWSRKLAHQQPRAVLGWFLGVLILVYVPMTLFFAPLSYWAWGPFFIQQTRIFFYLVYFLLGLALGATGEPTILRPDGALAAKWGLWVTASATAFTLLGVSTYFSHHIYSPVRLWTSVVAFAFSVCGAVTCFAFLAFFLRFVKRRIPLLDNLFVCSYGIYLMHIFFVSWSQFSLLTAPIPGWLKAAIVFACSAALSWGVTALARRSPVVARII
jgi:peptidoglycan/LPS O-acetylase OafA/YrhL